MMENGLAVVENPSQLFLNQREEEMTGPVSGAIAVTMEGSRPFLVEVQVFFLFIVSCEFLISGNDHRLEPTLSVISLSHKYLSCLCQVAQLTRVF